MASQTPVQLRWINGPSRETGVTWGVPWKKGELGREEILHLSSPDGSRRYPLQSWPTAYWPDGSVKWSAHSAVLPASEAEGVLLRKGQADAAASRVTVEETAEQIAVSTGAIRCVVAKQGNRVIEMMERGAAVVSDGGSLVALTEVHDELSGIRTIREEPFNGLILKAAVEAEGPVRAVIRLDGRYKSRVSGREWLPYTLRLYFYAGLDSFRLVHTFHYDGNPNTDFIKGLGISFSVPMERPHYNRHVRFAGDEGFFRDSPKSMYNRRTKGKYLEKYEAQLQGKSLSFDETEDAYYLGLLKDAATWDSFKLLQDSSEHYTVWKRTKERCSWVKGAEGRRAGGLGYVGGAAGGIAVGLKNFWRKHPSGMEITGTATERAGFTVWFWSPDAAPMDLRHYDTETHVASSYEGAEELRATPYGIANTHELTVWCLGGTPGPDVLDRLVRAADGEELLVCTPEYYHETRAFGLWSLPDRSTPEKAYLEDRLDGIIAFYQEETEARKWYGFWDYGDFMHSYDAARHVWNYDLGGCAWQNSELVPNMWLWVMFLRSGRADIFRMAEAMTRHTSEVDMYHFGEYAGLGSRHNVMHWGCGCKEPRIAMAGLHRYYYYLTADERIGDCMELVKDVDYTTVTLDPLRAYYPKDEHPTHIRVGPDWAAFSSNWMTRWERFEDTFYRDKIRTGIECIKQAKYRMISGPAYGYNPQTGLLAPMGDDNRGRHLSICMGGPQVWFELADMLDDPEWNGMMAEYGVYYNAPQEEKDLLTHGEISHSHFEHPVLSVAIAAYGAYYRQDPVTAGRCWRILHENPFGAVNLQEQSEDVVYMDHLKEIDWMNTNEASQWSLNTIISLELIGDRLGEYKEMRG